jgi:hypothetical protein
MTTGSRSPQRGDRDDACARDEDEEPPAGRSGSALHLQTDPPQTVRMMRARPAPDRLLGDPQLRLIDFSAGSPGTFILQREWT